MTESATNRQKLKIIHIMALALVGAGSASRGLAAGSQSGFNPAFQQEFPASMSTPAVGDYEHPNQLSWARLSCPPGEYVVGVSVRQGGWLAQVGGAVRGAHADRGLGVPT